MIEGFSIECRKKKFITLGNHNKRKNRAMNQSEFKANTCNRHQARENACERDTIGFGFNSHWLRKWREFYHPITARSNAKPKQKRNRPFPSCRVAVNLTMKARLSAKLFILKLGLFAYECKLIFITKTLHLASLS